MKRSIFLIFGIVLCIVLYGCSFLPFQEAAVETTTPTEATQMPTIEETVPFIPDADYTFSRGKQLLGTDVGGMTTAEACAAINETLQQYSLSATINGSAKVLTGASLGLSCSEESVIAYVTALENGEETDGVLRVDYDRALLSRRITEATSTQAQSSTIVYNEETALYELTPSSNGKHVDMDTVMFMLDSAIHTQRPTLAITVTEYEDLPAFPMDDPATLRALDKANNYLSTYLTYDFILDDGTLHSEYIEPETIVSMIAFDENLNGYVKEDVLQQYVDELNEKFGHTSIEGQFTTTFGTIAPDITVSYYAQSLNTVALYDDIKHCLENSISGIRMAPQLDELDVPAVPFDGNYVEVDLTNQRLWLYINNECLLDTPIVTGNVSRGMNTPTGVYKVNLKRNGAILVGADYETWVRYWMPFYRGYGLHDAYWRSQFGGNEYLYNGSHGCVNIPPENAKILFQNISPGIAVILYGGASNNAPLQQEILGTDAYDLTIYAEPFQLDAKVTIGNSKMTYTSSNPSVASVTEDGLVTIHKAGSAQIRIEYEGSRYYTDAQLNVQINVSDPCGNDHNFGPWLQAKAPSCEAGISQRVCKVCTKTESKSIPANKDHCYGGWYETMEPDCDEGEESRDCIICGDSESRPLPPVHNFRSWKETTEPTCTSTGINTRTCRNCGHEETELVPAIGHDFDSDEEFCQNDCGRKNPNYIPPKEEDEE